MTTPCDRILLEHGNGGLLSNELISETFLPHLKNPFLERLADGAVFTVDGAGSASAPTPSWSSPLLPRRSIGSLAATARSTISPCAGGTPLYLSAGFVIEEGFLREELERIVRSLAAAAQRAGSRWSPGTPRSCLGALWMA